MRQNFNSKVNESGHSEMSILLVILSIGTLPFHDKGKVDFVTYDIQHSHIFCSPAVHATNCLVHPSEYAYHKLSVTRSDVIGVIAMITKVLFQQKLGQKIMSTVRAHNLDWLILTLDQSNTVEVTVMFGFLGRPVYSCYSNFKHKSV